MMHEGSQLNNNPPGRRGPAPARRAARVFQIAMNQEMQGGFCGAEAESHKETESHFNFITDFEAAVASMLATLGKPMRGRVKQKAIRFHGRTHRVLAV